MALKPGPKRIATSTGKPDQRQRDNKDTPGNTPSLKPPVSKRNSNCCQKLQIKNTTIKKDAVTHLFLFHMSR